MKKSHLIPPPSPSRSPSFEGFRYFPKTRSLTGQLGFNSYWYLNDCPISLFDRIYNPKDAFLSRYTNFFGQFYFLNSLLDFFHASLVLLDIVKESHFKGCWERRGRGSQGRRADQIIPDSEVHARLVLVDKAKKPRCKGMLSEGAREWGWFRIISESDLYIK